MILDAGQLHFLCLFLSLCVARGMESPCAVRIDLCVHPVASDGELGII